MMMYCNIAFFSKMKCHNDKNNNYETTVMKKMTIKCGNVFFFVWNGSSKNVMMMINADGDYNDDDETR